MKETNETYIVTPRVSVIIITYNQESSIADCIESVIRQKRDFPMEIVIGEDCSTDGTRAVCERYAEDYPDIIKIMPKSTNKGIVSNYFDCLEACKGEYIADCAGDDTWASPCRLSSQVKYLDENPDKAVVVSDWNIISGNEIINSKAIAKYKCWRKNNSGMEALKNVLGSRSNFPLLSAMLFRRRMAVELLQSIPYAIRRDEWKCEDLPLVAGLASKGDFGYLSITASNYMVSERGVSNTTNTDKLFDIYASSTECIMELCKIYNIDIKDIKKSFKNRLNYIASLAFSSSDNARKERMKAIARASGKYMSVKTRIYLFTMTRPRFYRILNILKSFKRFH